jgi:hypothetical protein
MPDPSLLAVLFTLVGLALSAVAISYVLHELERSSGKVALVVVLGLLSIPTLYLCGSLFDVALRDWLWTRLRPEDHGMTPILPPGPYFDVGVVCAMLVGYGVGWAASSRRHRGPTRTPPKQ